MCCILYIPMGVETPSINKLETIFISNPHGCGYCDSDGNSYHSLNFFDFYRQLKRRKTTAELIIHFRYATHGSRSVSNCHPFYDEKNDIWFAHNGILDIDSVNDMTDSEIFFRERFIESVDRFGYDSEKPWMVARRDIGHSRFIFMKSGEVKMMGNWILHDGVYYSNMNWSYRMYSQGASKMGARYVNFG